jgi:hypothetical protein
MSDAHEATARTTLPVKLARQVQSQFTAFSNTDMTAYTFEKSKSDFKDARSDLSIYDVEGTLKLFGRDFGDRTFFWQP